LGPYMRQDGYLPSLPCHTGISTPVGKSHRNAVHLAHTHLSKIHILSLPIRTHFLYKIKHIMSKVLSVLISINVQAKSDINLGGQGIVITNQGVAIQPCFHVSKTYAIYKTGHWVVFIKTRTETCIKGWIELAVFKAFGEVLSFGLGVAERALVHLLTSLLVNGFTFVHSVVYSAHKQAHNQNKDLSSSSKREHMKYRA